jgi:transposase
MKRNRVILTGAQRVSLSQLITSGQLKGTKLRRAQILLAIDEHAEGKGLTTHEAMLAYDCSRTTVYNVRSRCVKYGFDFALNGKPRPVNRKSKIDGRAESQLIAMRCSDPPAGEARWTLRLLADKLVELQLVDSITPEGVKYVLKKLPSNHGGLNPG